MQVALIHPEIPPNTGNIARLCAATLTRLHLVDPLGFQITDRRLKRAGLDYWPHVDLVRHASLEAFLKNVDLRSLAFFSTKAERSYLEAPYQSESCLVFGNESQGLPERLREAYPDQFFKIPMMGAGVRSLNLSSAVAVVVYEALRRTGTI